MRQFSVSWRPTLYFFFCFISSRNFVVELVCCLWSKLEKLWKIRRRLTAATHNKTAERVSDKNKYWCCVVATTRARRAVATAQAQAQHILSPVPCQHNKSNSVPTLQGRVELSVSQRDTQHSTAQHTAQEQQTHKMLAYGMSMNINCVLRLSSMLCLLYAITRPLHG